MDHPFIQDRSPVHTIHSDNRGNLVFPIDLMVHVLVLLAVDMRRTYKLHTLSPTDIRGDSDINQSAVLPPPPHIMCVLIYSERCQNQSV